MSCPENMGFGAGLLQPLLCGQGSGSSSLPCDTVAEKKGRFLGKMARIFGQAMGLRKKKIQLFVKKSLPRRGDCCRYLSRAEVVELVDTLGSGSSSRKGVGVRVSPSAPSESNGLESKRVPAFFCARPSCLRKDGKGGLNIQGASWGAEYCAGPCGLTYLPFLSKSQVCQARRHAFWVPSRRFITSSSMAFGKGP